jgi:ATP-dependent exoDNAse (exonuclease V) alpha subunit
MTTHLSVRLCWHDSGWNGKICKDPKKNKFCIDLNHIRENKNEEFEIKNKGKHLSEFDYEKVNIPCKWEACVFSDKGYKFELSHPLKGKGLGYDFDDITETMKPSSLFPAPYRWLMVKNYDQIREKYDLDIRPLTADDLLYSNNNKKTWMDDVKLQEKLLKSFWGKLEEKKSLVVFYVNSTPAVEDTRRVIVGIGRIKEKGKMSRFGKTEKRPGPNYAWQRKITHNYPEEGFKLPYQEYLEQGADPKDILLTAPEDFDNEFKYVAEHVSNGAMLAIAEQLGKIIDTIQEDVAKEKVKLSEDWENPKKWIQRVIGELWENRGQYPGIGSVLQFLGFNRGMTYHQEVLIPIEKQNENVLNHTIEILDSKKEPEESYKADFSNAKRKWDAYSSDTNKRQLLELLMRLEISEDQVRRLMIQDKRNKSGISFEENQIINNPYLIAEYDEGEPNDKGEIISERVPLDVIDQAMIPSFYFPDKYQTDDDRRVRAIMVEELHRVSDEGDTLLNMQEMINKIEQRFPSERQCSPDLFLIMSNKAFYEERVEFLGDNGEFVALKELRDYERIVSSEITELIKEENKGEQPNWKKILDKKFGKVEESKLGKEIEQNARAEKSKALDTLYSKKFSVLTGRAGTGKTEVLNILIKGLIEEGEKTNDFLLLAPTGKARVRISKTLNVEDLKPQTIHQHLNKYRWLDEKLGFSKEDGKKTFPKNVIVDESSMMPIDLMATLIKSIEFSNVKRFILVGDPNQLPPIGPGRPFDDIVRWLSGNAKYRENLANLKERVRQKTRNSVCLKLADGFLRDFKSKDIEEVYSSIEQKKLKENDDLFVAEWSTHEELLEKIDKILNSLGITDYESYKKSVGLENRDISKCESWQVLSPVKQKEVSGTISLNTHLQNKFLGHTLNNWRTRKSWSYPKPFGETKDVVHEDKVIQIRNTSRLKSYPKNPESYVANGEIGIVRYYRKKYGQLEVSFTDQPSFRYLYYNGNSEYSVETNLDLAYAITIHKSQGSDFDNVILVIPEKAHNVSMEMMYTALTRFKKKTYLLIQNGIDTLQIFRHASSSETDRRNTFLFKIAVRDDIDKIPYAENRIHKTKQGFMVRSKSEVIIANELINAGISLTDKNYEQKLTSEDNHYDYKLPDFTFTHKGKEYCWEHLGMLAVESYRKSWEKKLRWYKDNGYYEQLITSKDGPDGSIDSKGIDKIIEEKLGIKIKKHDFSFKNLEESENVEFKSSVAWDYNNERKNKDLEIVIAKTISAFMNSYGGLLVIGVDDKKNILGLEKDFKLLKKQDEDGFQLKITEIISKFIGKEFAQLVSCSFEKRNGKKIAIVNIKEADEPTFVEDKNESKFFIRTNNSAQPLNQKESHNYITKHWN